MKPNQFQITDKHREYLNGAGNNDLVWMIHMLRREFDITDSEATSIVVQWAREAEPKIPKAKPRWSAYREAALRQMRNAAGRFIPNRYGFKWKIGK